MDMNRWQIEWNAVSQEWIINYFGPGVTVAASYNADYVEQNPITLCFADRKVIKVPWPWSHDTSPSPIRVMKRLCKLAEIHRPKQKGTP